MSISRLLAACVEQGSGACKLLRAIWLLWDVSGTVSIDNSGATAATHLCRGTPLSCRELRSHALLALPRAPVLAAKNRFPSNPCCPYPLPLPFATSCGGNIFSPGQDSLPYWPRARAFLPCARWTPSGCCWRLDPT